MSQLTVDDIWHFHDRYPPDYDKQYYSPHIEAGRKGDLIAIEALTRWKNTGKNGKPMNLSGKKRAALKRLLSRLPRYQADSGEVALRYDFRWRAPVWSIFWCHVLYGAPIFDRYTYIAWQHLAHGRTLSVDEARITAPGHWELYDRYRAWLTEELARLSSEDTRITERMLDRALFKYGQRLLKGKPPIPSSTPPS